MDNENVKQIEADSFSVLDSNLESFKSFTSNWNIGTYKGCLVFITLAWEKLKNIREDIMNKVKTGDLKDNDELKNLLFKVYGKMESLENKAIYLRERIKEIESMGLR